MSLEDFTAKSQSWYENSILLLVPIVINNGVKFIRKSYELVIIPILIFNNISFFFGKLNIKTYIYNKNH